MWSGASFSFTLIYRENIKKSLNVLSYTGPSTYNHYILGDVAQLVTCKATESCLTADPGVASSIPAQSHTFVEIDHELFQRSFSSLPLNHSRGVVVRYAGSTG